MVKNLLNGIVLDIFIVMLSLLTMLALSVVLFFSIKKEYKKIRTGGKKDGILSFKDFNSIANKWIANLKINAKCHIIQLDVRMYDELVKSIGVEQYNTIFKQLVDEIYKIQPYGIRVCQKETDKLLIVVRNGGGIDIDSLSQLIIKNVGRIYKVGDMKVDIKINLAIATAPQDGVECEKLKHLLDMTMIMSRRKGYNEYEFYSTTFANESSQEYIYYQEIREAIKTKEFNLYFQAVVDSTTMEVVSAETLMRWFHKTKGVLPPSEFLSIMEQTGDINWVGEWCFEQMIIQHNAWKRSYAQDFMLAYNLSERQLNEQDLTSHFTKIIKKYRANPKDYYLEIGEGAIYSSSGVVQNNLKLLSEAGFRLLFDGFGKKTVSPLSLQGININAIKIERSFWVNSMEDELINQMLKMLLDYSKKYGLILIALGVEANKEVAYLKKQGIRLMQGYLFDKPKEAKDFIGNVLLTPWEDELKQFMLDTTKNEV